MISWARKGLEMHVGHPIHQLIVMSCSGFVFSIFFFSFLRVITSIYYVLNVFWLSGRKEAHDPFAHVEAHLISYELPVK